MKRTEGFSVHPMGSSLRLDTWWVKCSDDAMNGEKEGSWHGTC